MKKKLTILHFTLNIPFFIGALWGKASVVILVGAKQSKNWRQFNIFVFTTISSESFPCCFDTYYQSS